MNQNYHIDARTEFTHIITSRKYGSSSVFFKDPLTAQAVRELGGWQVVCDWSEDEIQEQKHVFTNLYIKNKKSGKSFDPLIISRTKTICFIGHFGKKEKELITQRIEKQFKKQIDQEIDNNITRKKASNVIGFRNLIRIAASSKKLTI